MGRFLALCLLLSLVGCASKPLLNDESWRLIGKLSFKTKTESRILGIEWRHQGAENTVVLRGPLGVKVASITTQGGHLMVDTGLVIFRQEETDLITTGELAGLKLPWRQLASWVRSGEFHVKGEDNWEFRITEVSPEGPISMALEHPDISMKLKVIRWEIN